IKNAAQSNPLIYLFTVQILVIIIETNVIRYSSAAFHVDKIDLFVSERCFHSKQWTVLIYSLLAVQYQVLRIRIKHRINIFDLIKIISNL
ncbi:unnamed protein product, partial [Rotaria socialis]